MFDAHVHLERLLDPTSAIVGAREAGVRGFLMPSLDPEGWSKQLEIGKEHADVHIAWGLHPWYAAVRSADERLIDLAALRTQCEKIRPVALGEMGLDHHPHFDKKTWVAQEKVFVAQLAMAHLLDLPIILHVVRSHGTCLQILRDMGVPKRGGVVHGFSGSKESAAEYVRLGLHVSFSGAITKRQFKKAREAASTLPLSHLLIETDAPDQTPAGWSKKDNEPANLPIVLNCIATLRGEDPLDVARETEQNARKLFQV